MTLNEYIRDILHMTGFVKSFKIQVIFKILFLFYFRTKVTCREGSCGACVINVEIYDYVTKGPKNIAINTVGFFFIIYLKLKKESKYARFGILNQIKKLFSAYSLYIPPMA